MEKKKATAPAPELELHEFCKMIPEHSEEDYRRLVDNLKATGKLIEAITTFEDKILDGRGRYKACSEAGIEPHYTPFQGNRREAFAFVLSKNLARRHLTIELRKALAAKIYTEDPTISTNQVAKAVGLSNKTVEQGRPKRNLENPNSKGSPPRKTPSGRGVGGRHKSTATEPRPNPAHSGSSVKQLRGELEAARAYIVELEAARDAEAAAAFEADSVRDAKAVAAAKRDLMQKLQPHFDELEQGVALLRGDAERRDAPPMADRPKP